MKARTAMMIYDVERRRGGTYHKLLEQVAKREGKKAIRGPRGRVTEETLDDLIMRAEGLGLPPGQHIGGPLHQLLEKLVRAEGMSRRQELALYKTVREKGASQKTIDWIIARIERAEGR